MTKRHQWTVSIYTWTFALVFASYNLYYLPVVDFRPYHIGADLKKALTSGVRYITTFILEKDGVQKEFTLEDYLTPLGTEEEYYVVDEEASHHVAQLYGGVAVELSF